MFLRYAPTITVLFGFLATGASTAHADSPSSATATVDIPAPAVTDTTANASTHWAASAHPVYVLNQGMLCSPTTNCAGDTTQHGTGPGLELGVGLRHHLQPWLALQARIFGRYARTKDKHTIDGAEPNAPFGRLRSVDNPTVNVWLAGTEVTARIVMASSWYIGVGPRFGYFNTSGSVAVSSSSPVARIASFDASGAFFGAVVETGLYFGKDQRFEVGARASADIMNNEAALAPALAFAYAF